ncbi:MAG: ACP S-malonyltransferase [Leptospiraceae bacterium]|nr:ACP S-malonyltransferase [Leptospiraceae bacterium]MBK7053822.1 ACP S-malonyltransferase [Leptospiraceae bacterium]MBK9500057.1 ACP S-malonyltransferase [Leptospiraceae bacterium]MBP9161559.1 ACP S-malonyltransferase [Leptospiraceae bacterium]
MSTAKLLNSTTENGKKFFLQFGGQGSPYLKEVSKLYKEEPLLKEFFEVAFATLNKIENEVGKSDILISEGLDLKSWIENPDSAPSDDYQIRGSVSVAMIFITQAANYHLMTLKGFPVDKLTAATAGVTGHSQGIIGGALAAVAKDGKDFYKTFADFLSFTFYLGYRAQEKYPIFEVEKAVIDGNAEIGDKNPSPMVAVIGYSKEELEARVDAANKDLSLSGQDKLSISLYNTPDSMIISAKPSSLLAFRKKYKSEMDERKAKFVYLRTTAPFHCPFMEGTWEKFEVDLKTKVHFPYTVADLKLPLHSIFDGRQIGASENLAEVLFKEIVIKALHWDKAVGALFTNASIATVIDCGPSVVTSKLTGGQLTSKNLTTQVLCLSNNKDLKVIFEA